MAPRDIQQQTYDIIHCLFDPSPESSDFKTSKDIQSDGEDDGDDSFDAVIIADKLRELGDALDDQVVSQFKNALATASLKQVETAFSKTVDMMCKTWVSERGEVVTEKHLLRASVTLGLYVKRNCPQMISAIQGVMATFLNTHVTPWVSQQGGWDRVASE
ncbi:hypothetical protein SKAU_G00102980 [Synaphobranchus kaupii]|uniref:Bcl-2 Bcl-2 homology region 1-3 domain-containing protein n=1 Tax=Synaphobranchus kaupii TaxID=118154 RepID=A0A9Q1FZU5_SYNKA|nr:hypothetical protein SKAU_G00102980 [Synaphobranchus kaupii]